MASIYEDDFENNLGKATKFLKNMFSKTQPIDELKEISFYGGNVRAKTIVTKDYEIQAILSIADESPVEITLRRKGFDLSYRWVSPIWDSLRLSHFNNYQTPTIAFETVIADERWVETDTLSDIQNKIQCVLDGKDVDSKVDILLDLDKDALKKLRASAKKANLSLDEFLERLLLLEISRMDKKQPID